MNSKSSFSDRSADKRSDSNGPAGVNGMRVLLLFPHMIMPGGALNYMLKLAEILTGNGATVGILTLQVDQQRYGRNAGAQLLNVGGPVTSSLGYWLLHPFWQMKISRIIREWQPDVLIPQVFPANWWAWLYKRHNKGARIVWVCQEPSAFIHSRNWIDALQPFWKKYLARALNPLLARLDIRLSRFSDKIIANSNFTAGTIERVYNRKADAIAYPAIDFHQFHPEANVEKQEALVTVAKLSRFKRVDFLLRVFSLVLKQHPRLVYHIVGRGEDEVKLKTLARELNVSANVIFHGGLSNEQLAALHRRSLLFLHGSIEEPFGMAPLEAIACGTPVIAHKSGGPLEFVDDSCGRLIDSLAAEEWSEQICNFLTTIKQQAGYFDQVSDCARRFTWESTLSPILHIIQQFKTGPVAYTHLNQDEDSAEGQ